MKSKVKQLTFLNFPDKFDTPSLILFSRNGCHYCRNLKPLYNEISMYERYDGVFDFYVVDSDEETLLYDKFSPDGVPTLFVVSEDDGLEIPYPKNPAESGYSREDITNFLDKLMEVE